MPDRHRLQAVALDCADPVRLAEFYAELLGSRVVMEPDEPDWVEVVEFEGTQLAFQRVDDYQPPGSPGEGHPQQVHPDFDVDDIEADEKRVLELGGTALERTDQLREDANWRVPAGPCQGSSTAYPGESPPEPRRSAPTGTATPLSELEPDPPTEEYAEPEYATSPIDPWAAFWGRS